MSEKSRLLAFLLAFFFGGFGVHRFYLGKTSSAVVMLLLTLSIFGIIVTMVWALVDWIVILTGGATDREGRLVSAW